MEKKGRPLLYLNHNYRVAMGMHPFTSRIIAWAEWTSIMGALWFANHAEFNNVTLDRADGVVGLMASFLLMINPLIPRYDKDGHRIP